MRITPAILVDNKSELENQIKSLKEFFTEIDIDVCIPPFTASESLALDQILEVISSDEFSEINFGFHLMVRDPEELLVKIRNTELRFRSARIYLHQESDNVGYIISNFNFPENWSKCLAIKLESELATADFYNNFTDIQIMSIKTESIGGQGSKFEKTALDKALAIKDLGYTGTISMDGGINLKSAENLKNSAVTRVSIGSYFSKSKNIKKSLEALQKIFE